MRRAIYFIYITPIVIVRSPKGDEVISIQSGDYFPKVAMTE